jgi:hypothetical protein
VSESKPKRTENQLFNDAISAINKATDTSVLDAAYNRFKGTNFEKAIVAACKNKKLMSDGAKLNFGALL